MKRAYYFGLIYLITYLPLTALSFFHSHGFDWANAIIATLGNASFLVLLFALMKLSNELHLKGLNLNLKFDAGVTILFIILNPFVAFSDGITSPSGLMILIALAITTIMAGIINIKYSKTFHTMESNFKDAKEAAEWKGIAGWIMVTVIFAPIGLIVSYIGDWYMWRIVRDALGREEAMIKIKS